MGMVFGKETVAEPHFDILAQRKNVKTTYEMRQYGERFAASVSYTDKEMNKPFGTLARYIGVFGTPQNEGSTSISMTAPVVMEQDSNKKEPETIAMTAPVVMESEGEMNKMMFMLPAEYDDMSKIPKPTNPNVHIEVIPAEIGVAHRFSGRYTPESSKDVAKAMGDQLIQDGLEITEDYVLDNYQYLGYNPPFTLGPFRRNEVYLKLSEDQVSFLKDKFPVTEGGLVGGSSMKGKTMFSLGFCGLAFGAYAVGMLLKSRSQYRRL